MQRSTQIAIAVIVVAMIALSFWVLRPKPLSDTDQIRQQLGSIIKGADNKSTGAIMAVVSKDYQDDSGLNPDKLRVILAQAYQRSPEIDVNASDPLVNVTGDTASLDTNLTIRSLEDKTVIYTHPVHLDWQREKGYSFGFLPTKVWRVVRADYGPMFGDTQ